MSLSLKKHLFLTGEKHVGKSTLLRKLIGTEHISYSGFETRPLMVDGERRGFMMHGFADIPAFENDCIICVRVAERKSVPVLPVFEANGVQILRISLQSEKPVLLMDELGKMEDGASAFHQAVLSALDSRKRVLGVLQKGSCFTEELAKREDVTLLTVTETNRNELFSEILEAWRDSES